MGEFSFSGSSKMLKAKANAMVSLEDDEKQRWLVLDDHLQDEPQNQRSTCGSRCFVVTSVALFLFLTFVALPGGSFLIIHGRHENSLPFLLGGAAVVCLPILTAIILAIICCVRCYRRKATFTSVNTAQRV